VSVLPKRSKMYLPRRTTCSRACTGFTDMPGYTDPGGLCARVVFATPSFHFYPWD
jgi:hypothetical protein